MILSKKFIANLKCKNYNCRWTKVSVGKYANRLSYLYYISVR